MSHQRLQGLSKKELLDLARKKKLTRWASMSKEQLIRALGKNAAKPQAKAAPAAKASRATRPTVPRASGGATSRAPAVRRQKSASRTTQGNDASVGGGVGSSKFLIDAPPQAAVPPIA